MNKATKFSLLLLTTVGLGLLQANRPLTIAIPSAAPTPQKTAKTDTYGPPTSLALLKDKAVKESSGLAASRSFPGVYWTHNDSGDGPFIYAFDVRGIKGVWRLSGATARDWEDIAVGPGPSAGTNYLYIGDIGDNRGSRTEIVVYRVPEPELSPRSLSKSKAAATAPSEALRLRYPDGSHDAEALLVHPHTGNIYIVTKVAFANPEIYEAAAPLKTGRTITLNRVGTLEVPSLLGGIITGGAISPDGRRVAFCDYMQGYEAVLENASSAFDTIWKRPLVPISLGSRKQGEAITYRLDGKALLMTSEGSPMPLMQVVRR
ncbi:MAG TPA: hypothetical protein VFH15_12195 [Pyrinomonadaceae bacterium]|nr:hypothetical protein [Pyrinomonadaceae bacterium]